MKKLTIFANDQIAYEYDKDITLEQGQLAFLDKVDSDMDRGIKIQGKLISSPDSKQRATFVALNLIRALQQDNQPIIYSSCAYLANRFPRLVEVHANDQGNTVNIELVEEH